MSVSEDRSCISCAPEERPRAEHISVCVCTYQRPHLLARLLCDLGAQDTGGLFTYSLVIADNDRLESAKLVVANFAATSAIPVRYCVEPRQGIALARNKATENSTGDLVALLDDDERPAETWLVTLFRSLKATGADGVLGPVKPLFDTGAPRWVTKCGLFDRPDYPTGTILPWRETRTGNVLFKRELLDSVHPPFRPEFRSGEDQDFFKRLIETGRKFTWCSEAAVYEAVPAVRWSRKFMLRRALLRGTCAAYHAGPRGIATSLVAIPLYTAALPFALAAGHHRFMRLLVKLCDHLGKILALLGINVIREPYVTE